MKIAVVTANVGKMDPIYGMGRQTMPATFHYYNENNLPFPLTNLNSRLRAKYIKMQMHRFLPDYEAYIWVDGRIKIEGLNFIEHFVDELSNKEMALFKHRERSNVYEEFDYIINEMMEGNEYLLSRYGNQQLVKELLYLKEQGLPNDFPLFMGGFHIRRNSLHANNFFDEWWRKSIEFSVFDQGMLSLCLWKSSLDINAMTWDEIRTFKFLNITSHVKKENEIN